MLEIKKTIYFILKKLSSPDMATFFRYISVECLYVICCFE